MRLDLERLTIVATIATLFLAASPASAQLKKQRHLLELGLYVGPSFLPTKHELMGGTAPEHQSFDKVAAELGLRFGYLPIPYVGAELELSVIPSKADGRGAVGYGIRGHVIAQYPVWKDLTPFVVVGGGMLGLASPANLLGKDADAAFHWGVGLKYYFLKWVAVRLDFRHLISDGLEDKPAHYFSVLAGVSVVLNWERDSDKDGIPDGRDHCPKRPGKAPSGCPDTDGDGLTDNRDKCPKEAAKTPDGCPLDADKDGITDDKDQCPKRAGPEPHGCPDSDRDGVADHIDKCPKVAARTKDGCPNDADGDGIVDAHDKCPNKPETKNGYKDLDGCPDKIPIAIRRFSGNIKGIYFAYNKAKIRRRSFRLLRKAAKILKRYVGLRIRIRGHTDNRGKLSLNLKLSLRRAEAVKAYLVKQGIDAGRLEVEGVGPKEPIASNKRRRGRAKNRRIEFKLIK